MTTSPRPSPPRSERGIILRKPVIQAVTLSVGLRWRGWEYLFQEKSDGIWDGGRKSEDGNLKPEENGSRGRSPHQRKNSDLRPLASGFWLAGVVAEWIPASKRAITGGFEWVAHDLTAIDGQDARGLTLRARWPVLCGLVRHFPENMRLCRVGTGGEFLEAELARGGEGVVAKAWDAPFGTAWWKCKRQIPFYCMVTGKDVARGTVDLVDTETLEDRGRMPLRAKFWQVRVGTVLKVVAECLTAGGKLRSGRLDTDTATSWLVKY